MNGGWTRLETRNSTSTVFICHIYVRLSCLYLDEDSHQLSDGLDDKQQEKHHHDKLSEPG